MPYNVSPLQRGGLLRPAESVPALSSAPLELWRQRGKPLTIQVSKSSLNVNGLIVKMLGNISRNLILMIIVPRCPNELAELREGAFRCGGGGDPVYLSQTPTFLNYRQGDDDDNL